jgi:hypothetical protein
VTVSRVFRIDPPRLTCWNELDGNGLCYDVAFVPNDMYVTTTGIDKPHAHCIHMGRAAGIVPFVRRDRPRGDDD